MISISLPATMGMIWLQNLPSTFGFVSEAGAAIFITCV
jgi:hypothetical protein